MSGRIKAPGESARPLAPSRPKAEPNWLEVVIIEKLLECFVNPAKSSILLQLYTQKQMTAKELKAACPEIPHATLYRHLSKMVDDGILEVVQERKVRAVTEKTYGVKIDIDNFQGIPELLQQNRGDVFFQLYMQFSMQLAREFSEYCARQDIDIVNDCASFFTGPVRASKEELQEAIIKIGEILTPLRPWEQKEEAAGRNLHSLAIIVTPPKKMD